MLGDRWFVDVTYVKVNDRWTSLYRAVDQFGQFIDVWLTCPAPLAPSRMNEERRLTFPETRGTCMSAEDRSARWPEPGKGDVVALIAGFVSGQSLQAIATQTGLSVSTVQRRRRDPYVRQAIAAAMLDRRRQVLGRLGEIRYQALEELAELLHDQDPMVRLRAVTVVLSQCLRYEQSGLEDPGLEHSSGADPGAELLLSEQMSDRAWDIDPTQASIPPSEGADADAE